MAVPRNFKNGPMSPMGRATGHFCKKNYKPVLGQRGAGARQQGAVAPPRATGSPPLYKPPTLIPSSFEPKNFTKNP